MSKGAKHKTRKLNIRDQDELGLLYNNMVQFFGEQLAVELAKDFERSCGLNVEADSLDKIDPETRLRTAVSIYAGLEAKTRANAIAARSNINKRIA